jgi:hypothetical protein
MPLEVMSFAGTPSETGGRHGDLLAEGVRAMCEARLELCLQSSGTRSRRDLPAAAAEALSPVARGYLLSIALITQETGST